MASLALLPCTERWQFAANRQAWCGRLQDLATTLMRVAGQLALLCRGFGRRRLPAEPAGGVCCIPSRSLHGSWLESLDSCEVEMHSEVLCATVAQPAVGWSAW